MARVARAWNHAFVDGTLDCHVRIPCPFGAKIAQRGKSGLQLGIGMAARQQHAVFHRLFQNLVVPAGFVIRMQQYMRMQIHQSGNQRPAGQFDAFRIGRRSDIRTGGVYFSIHDQYRPSRMGLAFTGPDFVRN